MVDEQGEQRSFFDSPGAYGDMAEMLFRPGAINPAKTFMGRLAQGLNPSWLLYPAVLDAGIGFVNAPRRHAIAHTVGSFATGMTVGMTAALGQAFIPIPVLGAVVGGVTGMMVDPFIRRPLTRAIQSFTQLDRHVRHLEFGGDYEDNRLALTMRQRAASEMGNSLLNARAYLGREAFLMHQ